MPIKFSKKFGKNYDKAEPKIKLAFDKRLKLFLLKPFEPQLSNHPLTGKYSGYRSINITGDWRAIFSTGVEEKGEKFVIFEILGTHSQLYK